MRCAKCYFQFTVANPSACPRDGCKEFITEEQYQQVLEKNNQGKIDTLLNLVAMKKLPSFMIV